MSKPRPVYRCDKLTMKVLDKYANYREAESDTGEYSVYGSCRYRRVGPYRHVWRFADDYDPNETFEGKRNRPVACGNIETESIVFYENITQAADKLGLEKGAIVLAMKRGSIVNSRYRFKYAR